MTIYTPFLDRLFVSDDLFCTCVLSLMGITKPDEITRTVDRCKEVIRRVTGDIIRNKKAVVEQASKSGDSSKTGKDLLTLMCKSHSTNHPT